jgi:serine/threonine protein kinase
MTSLESTRYEELLRQLPLPLAQLFLRALNGKNALERHNAAYYLWEVSLKLLGSVAIVEYIALNENDPKVSQRLQSLARPSTGHWWEFVRLLLPILGPRDPKFAELRDLLLGKSRDDLPRLAGLDGTLFEALYDRREARATVELRSLFDRLVAYRNRVIGHGAAGLQSDASYDKVGRSLIAGLGELFGRLDVLAGRQLVMIAEVNRARSGDWSIERYSLVGESPRRLDPKRMPETAAALLPRSHQVYLESDKDQMLALHPLVLYEPETAAFYFLNSRRKEHHPEYLCYSTGEIIERDELRNERRELMARALGACVDEATFSDWAKRSRAEEPVAQEEVASLEGHTIGDFEHLSRIGRGGMGVVYRAWQPSLGRQVALKCMLRTGDPKSEARFAREIRALGRVEHPNVVKAFASGSQGDQWFYAMELVEGADLSRVGELLAHGSASDIDVTDWQQAVSTASDEARQNEQPISHSDIPHRPTAPRPMLARSMNRRGGRGHITQVVQIVRQVADAAHALHEAGVIHRDIKPGNVLVTPDGDRAVLMDLGLAQLADESDGRLTRTRQFVGTLRYASPEQVLSVGHLDRRTDVYSLGATLYELLTLRPLYGATDETPTHELMRKIGVSDPEPASHLNPHIPKDLEAIVEKCLEKDPASRYPNAAELSAELERFLGGMPVKAHPVGAVTRAWRWCKRRPTVAAPLCAGALVAILCAATSAALIRQAREHTAVQRQFDEKLNAPQLEPSYLQEMEESVQTQFTPEDAEKQRDRLYHTFARAIDERIQQPWLTNEAPPAIERALNQLALRSPALHSELNAKFGQTLFQREFDPILAAPQPEASYLQKMEEIVHKFERLAPAEAKNARDRLYRTFAHAIQGAIHQPRLSAEEGVRLKSAVNLLATRAPALHSDLNTELRERLAQWEPLCDLVAPFLGSEKVFQPDTVRTEGAKLYHVVGSGADGQAALPTKVPCRGDFQLEASFGAGWQTASVLGFNATPKGYAFLLSVNDPRVDPKRMPATTVRSFGAAVKSKSRLHLCLLRDQAPLRVVDLDAAQLAPELLRLYAKREGDSLQLQLNSLAPIEFNDGFPLPTAANYLALSWPEKVPLEHLAVQQRLLSPAPSPLERADALFDAGMYEKARQEYSQQMKISPTTGLRQESRYKVAMCLSRSNRLNDARSLFDQLAAEPGERWPVLAKLQLCVDHLRRDRLDAADAIIQSLASQYRPEEIVSYIPADVASKLLDCYTSVATSSSYSLIRREPDRIQKRERLLAVQELVSAPRHDIINAQKILLLILVDEGQHIRAMELAQKLIDDTTVRPSGGLFALYTTAAIQAKAPRDALRAINKWLTTEPGQYRPEYLGLLIHRSQLAVARGDWETAMKDVDAFFASASRPSVDQDDDGASAALLKGFLLEQKRDMRGAEEVWKVGYEGCRKRGELGSLNASVLGSLSNAITADDADVFLSRVLTHNARAVSAGFGYLRQHLLPNSVVASHLRNMWRTSHGREYARAMAFGQLSLRMNTTSQVVLSVFEIGRHAIQNTDDPQPLTKDEDEVLWKTSEDLIFGYQGGSLNEMQGVQLYFALIGNNNSIGWQAVAPTLKPRYRGPLAYVFGRRCVHLKRLDEARAMFRTAIDDAAKDSAVQRLADAELQRIESVSHESTSRASSVKH